jgi:hypothetical protein
MENPPGRRGSYLFTIRVWAEQLGEGQAEWRGKVQYIPGGEAHYFRDWSALVTLLLEMLPRLEGASAQSVMDGECR